MLIFCTHHESLTTYRMKNHYVLRLFCLWLLLLPACVAHAQCPSGNVTLTSQAQVDAFPAGCVNFSGDLGISGSDITNLSGLGGLRTNTVD